MTILWYLQLLLSLVIIYIHTISLATYVIQKVFFNWTLPYPNFDSVENGFTSGCYIYNIYCSCLDLLVLDFHIGQASSKHKNMRYYHIYGIRDIRDYPDSPFPWFPRWLMALPHQLRHLFCFCSFVCCDCSKLGHIIVHFCPAAQQVILI